MTDSNSDSGEREGLSVREPQRVDYLSWATDNLDELRSVCSDCGASNAFIRVLSDSVPNERHSVFMTLYRHHEIDQERVHPPKASCVEEAVALGGSVFNHLWEGKLWDAWVDADNTNRALMKKVFDKYEIESQCPHESGIRGWENV